MTCKVSYKLVDQKIPLRLYNNPMVFGKKKNDPVFYVEPTSDRISSVIGTGINWHGDLRGSGGVRIEGTMEGEIAMRGLIVVGETGKVTCKNLTADTVLVAGMVRGNITCQKLEIRSTGRIWGDVTTSSFASEDGAFFRGQMRMEEQINLPPAEEMVASTPDLPSENKPATKINNPDQPPMAVSDTPNRD